MGVPGPRALVGEAEGGRPGEPAGGGLLVGREQVHREAAAAQQGVQAGRGAGDVEGQDRRRERHRDDGDGGEADGGACVRAGHDPDARGVEAEGAAKVHRRPTPGGDGHERAPGDGGERGPQGGHGGDGPGDREVLAARRAQRDRGAAAVGPQARQAAEAVSRRSTARRRVRRGSSGAGRAFAGGRVRVGGTLSSSSVLAGAPAPVAGGLLRRRRARSLGRSGWAVLPR